MTRTRQPLGEAPRLDVDVAALSDVGRLRTRNEDHYLVARLERRLSTVETNLAPEFVPAEHSRVAYAMMVADGMGGAASGEVASREVIRRLVDLAIDTPDWIMKLDEGASVEVMRRFEDRFYALERALVLQAERAPELRGMGTTLTVACSLGAGLLVAHTGDSRAYLLRHEKLWQLTKDQTLAQTLADTGAISQDEVPGHPMAHVLTSAIGTRPNTVKVQLRHATLETGDRLLICSDGLSDAVSEAAIAAALGAADSASAACRELVDLALAGNCYDNVTAVVACYEIA
jgi:protein phosphatase